MRVIGAPTEDCFYCMYICIHDVDESSDLMS